MSGLSTIEVIIGVVFIYLLFSLFVTIIQELLATFFQFRANMLHHGIKRMLNDENQHELASKFYDHYLIKYLGACEKSKPSYITAKNFAKTLVDIIKSYGSGEDAVRQINAGLAGLPEGETQKLISSYWQDANFDINEFKRQLEQWFDEMMQRVSGWYKRKTQWIVLGISFIVVVAFNADSFFIVKKLSNDRSASIALADLAAKYTQTADQYEKSVPYYASGKSISKRDSLLDVANELLDRSKKLMDSNINPIVSIVGLGWQGENLCSCATTQGKTGNEPKSPITCFILRFLGWIVTTLALSLGAPFWFDVLVKFINLRGTGKIPEGQNKMNAKTSI